MCQVWCSSMQGIYSRLQAGQSAMGVCALSYIYIYRSAMRCAKFGVAVLQTCVLNWGSVNLPWIYVHCAIYETYLV